MTSSTRLTALTWLNQLVSEGLSNTEIVSWLRSEGMSYRTQTMFADINQERLSHFAAETIRGLGADDPIPSRLMRAWYGNTEYEYRAIVKYGFYDKKTKVFGEEGTAIYFDHPPSQNEVLEAWEIRKDSIALVCHPERVITGETSVVYYRNKNKSALQD